MTTIYINHCHIVKMLACLLLGRQNDKICDVPLQQAKCAAFPKYARYLMEIRAAAAAVIGHPAWRRAPGTSPLSSFGSTLYFSSRASTPPIVSGTFHSACGFTIAFSARTEMHNDDHFKEFRARCEHSAHLSSGVGGAFYRHRAPSCANCGS